MPLLQSWLDLLVHRGLRRSSRGLLPSLAALGQRQAERRHKPGESGLAADDDRNSIPVHRTRSSSKSDSESKSKAHGHFHHVTRDPARDEFNATVDRIQARLTARLPDSELSAEDSEDSQHLLTMQNMIWQAEQSTPHQREAAIRHATHSIWRHNRITADRRVLALYCDGANFTWGAGAAVVSPRLCYSSLKRVTRVDATAELEQDDAADEEISALDDITSASSELFGLVLALEAAARFSRRGQSVAIFCDSRGTVELNRKVWAESNGLGQEPLRRVLVALHTLEQRRVETRTHWLAKNMVVPGAHLAHVSARRAAHLEPGQEVEISEQTWQQQMASGAVGEARPWAQAKE